MIGYLVASQIVLWIAVIALGAVCIALARQVGLLHERIAPAGALMLPGRTLNVGDTAPVMSLPTLRGDTIEIGGARDGRSQLLFFLAPDCPVCKSLLPVLKSSAAAERDWLDVVLASDGEKGDHAAFARAYDLESFPYVLSEPLGRAFGVSKLPHAALIDEKGNLASMGLINTREHLESLFEAKERGVSSLQQYLRRREPAGTA
jgi:methylamine dehydrogenase accessory protein MauD